MKGADEDGKHPPNDVNDAGVRYTMAGVTDYTAAAAVHIAKNDMRPIVRGVVMEPCSEDSCCGNCYKLSDNDRAAFKATLDNYV